MNGSVLAQVAELPRLSADGLRERWRALFGTDPPGGYNKPFLVKRLAYRLQELAYGGLSASAKDRMRDRLKEHGEDGESRPARKDVACPVAGTLLVREWNDKRFEVIVRAGGFEFEGRKYRSLTAVTKAVTGTHWNGPAFFGLRKNASGSAGAAS